MEISAQKIQYEELLATYSHPIEAIELLKCHRVYLELIPSMRRVEESIITIPLPIVRIRHTTPTANATNVTTVESQLLPCELAILMCDPEWKIKTGKEIFVFIHRPNEDFSELLGRWRRTQLMLGKDYEWVLPSRYQHFLNDGADKIYPLFVVFEDTPERIKRGLSGSHLPFAIQGKTEVLEETI
ncbi:hypothetical protein ACQ4M3_16805 [Leptolyngbya sp. AN03gr2]|uniref:hypothetical protein n=1 Tax=unclassified Leptolyngbya TaxID=2650499 RepID=UPI003D31F124